MIKAFLNNEDIHKSTASKVFDVPLEEVTREQKAMRKRLISELYGVSAFGLSNQTNLSRKESADLIEAYYQSYQNHTSKSKLNLHAKTVMYKQF
jgi:DNA polymerase-1